MSSPSDYTPEINERHPNFPFTLLAPPPPEWELYDIPDKTHLRNRALDLGTFKKLVRHHTWGFDVVIGDRKTKERLLQVLKRIVYNQEAGLRPSWHEFVSRNCDAGPRLLRRSYNALQISIRYPDGVPGQPLRLTPGMPEGSAVQTAPDSTAMMISQPPQSGNHCVRQGYGNSSGGPGLVNLSMMPGAQAGLGLSLPSPGPLALTSNSGYSMGTLRQGFYQPFLGTGSVSGNAEYNLSVGARGGGFVPPASAPRGFIQSQPPQQMLPTEAPAASYGIPPKHPSTQVPIHDTNAGLKNIHHTARTVVNRELEQQPSSFLSTTSPVTVSYSSSAPYIRLSVSGEIPRFTCDSDGPWYPCRGWGPVSKGVSDAVDCIIVAGLLLDVGSTVADRGSDPNWAMRRSSLENAFLSVLSVNWGAIPEDQSAKRAQEFRDACREHLSINNTNNPLGAINGNPSFPSLSPASVWKICTSSFRQFQVQYSELFQPCSCQGLQQPKTRSQSTSYITTETRDGRNNRDADVDSSIRRFFQYERSISCPRCSSVDQAVLRRQFDLLPRMLAIHPDPRAIFHSHKSNETTIDYTDSRRLPQKATYRWLGGIYPVTTDKQQTVHKMFWNDRVSGEQADTGAIRVYDAAQVSGMIVGGVHPANRGERIPTSWWARGASPLLFYERVSTPSSQPVAPISGNVVLGRPDGVNTQQHGFPGQIGQGRQVMQQNGKYTQNQGIQPNQALNGYQASTPAFFAPFPDNGTSSWLDTNAAASMQHRQIGQEKEYAPPIFSNPQQLVADGWPSSPIPPEPEPQPQLQISTTSTHSPLPDNYMQLTEGMERTESIPGVPDFLLESTPAFPPLPELGGDISTDIDGQSGTTAQYPSSPFDMATVGNSDSSTPGSILNHTQLQENLANDTGIQSEIPNGSQASCINNNEPAAQPDLWEFNLDEASSAPSADFAALDDVRLNCYAAGHQVQQQQQGENQLPGYPNPVSVPGMGVGTAPSAGMLGCPFVNDNSSTSLRSKRPAPASEQQSGEIWDDAAGDAARKRAKR